MSHHELLEGLNEVARSIESQAHSLQGQQIPQSPWVTHAKVCDLISRVYDDMLDDIRKNGT